MRQGWKSKEDSFTPVGCKRLMVGMTGGCGLMGGGDFQQRAD